MIKYPKIKILGDQDNDGILTTPGKIVIEEKVDGANFSFYVEDDILKFCSRNQNLTDSEQIEKTGIPTTWKGIEPVLNVWLKNPEYFIPNRYCYGESLQRHAIQYDDIPGFIGYDIFDDEKKIFLDYRECEEIYTNMGLPFINIINEINVPNSDIDNKYLKSQYQKSAYKAGMAEGIVIKRYDTQQFAKIVSDEFKERNHEIFGKPLQKQTVEDKIASVYATPGRVNKIIHKMRDDNYVLEMGMMQYLPKKVVVDILEEEIINIYLKYKLINFSSLNKSVSRECAKILKNVINDNTFKLEKETRLDKNGMILENY